MSAFNIHFKTNPMKQVLFLFLSFLLLTSCSNKTEKQTEKKKPILVDKTITSEETVQKEHKITAQFSWFELKDDQPYSLKFETESGMSIHFEDIDTDTFDFVEKLNESETSEYNKGWGISYQLQEKWFHITYTKKENPKFLNDSIPLYVITKAILDTTVRKVKDDITQEEFTIKAKFKKFRLGDAEHYIFENESGETLDFGGSTIDNFEFGIELEDSKVNSDNQGWSSNKKLQGKWFTLTYIEREQQLYIDGPLGIVKVITKAILDTK